MGNRLFDIDYIEPTSIADATARRERLGVECQSIQAQLGNGNQTRPDGTLLTASEYYHWRRAAKSALTAKLEEMRRLRAYLRERSDAPGGGSYNGSTKKRKLDIYRVFLLALRALLDDRVNPQEALDAIDMAEAMLVASEEEAANDSPTSPA